MTPTAKMLQSHYETRKLTWELPNIHHVQHENHGTITLGEITPFLDNGRLIVRIPQWQDRSRIGLSSWMVGRLALLVVQWAPDRDTVWHSYDSAYQENEFWFEYDGTGWHIVAVTPDLVEILENELCLTQFGLE